MGCGDGVGLKRQRLRTLSAFIALWHEPGDPEAKDRFHLKKGVELMEAELAAWSKHLPIVGQTIENISEL